MVMSPRIHRVLQVMVLRTHLLKVMEKVFLAKTSRIHSSLAIGINGILRRKVGISRKTGGILRRENGTETKIKTTTTII
jgi:hypothetical protein